MALFDTPTKKQLIENASDVVKTLIFLKVDVNDINHGQISEISAIAVHLNELNCRSKKKSSLRIVDKLNLCFDPVTCYNAHISSLNKINNKLISGACKKQFDDEALNLLYLFLQRQDGPLCFLCHNGFRFDFQILQFKIKELGRSLEKINDLDVYCADSLWTFKTIDANQQKLLNSLERHDVTVFDMLYYTLSSLYERYLKKQMPEQLSAEERNMHLLELVFLKLPIFLKYLCCKKFAFIRPMHERNLQQLVPYSASAMSVDVTIQDIDTNVFVFFDLETTSLHDAKITEICLCAVHKSSILTAESKSMPRIQDKLLLVINPGTTIQPKASEISKLSNAEIKNCAKPEFDNKTVTALAQFLQQQTGPLCLVAHNGVAFDFPILRTYLQNHKQAFPIFSELSCADSLPALRTIGESEIENSFGKQKATSRRNPKYPKVSYSLSNVYKRYFSAAPKCFHTAEADVNALIKISCYKPILLQHVDSEKILLF